MSEEKLVALLGRPLTSVESANRVLYLKIAREHLSDLTCLNLESTTEDRVFEVREGYSTVFTDLFTEVNTVTVDGTAYTDYTKRQWNKRNAGWYNSIVLEDSYITEVTINADWGICSPQLELLLAKLFALITTMNTSNGKIKSKEIEDFRITFNDNTEYDQFMMDNEALIQKFSVCNMGYIRSGDVTSPYYSYPRFY